MGGKPSKRLVFIKLWSTLLKILEIACPFKNDTKKMIQSVSAQNMETLILYIYQGGQNAMHKM